MKPLLSICIPTYGHDIDLRVALETLVQLPTFADSDEIEVVISDNCSPDRTQEVCRKFVERFPGRIRYFRNETNIRDANFGLSLSRGEGLFLKLTNDTIVFRDSGLKRMLEAVRKYRDEKPVLFFSNQEKELEQRSCSSLSDFVDETSMWSTWIGSFGIWKEDMDRLTDFARMRDLYLTQVDVLCRMVTEKKRAEVFNYRFCDTFPRPLKGGYSVSLIFGNYYFRILKPYVATGGLTRAAYNLEKKRMLRNQILPFSLTFSHEFNNEGYFKYLFANYCTDYMYWCAMPFVIAAAVIKVMKKPLARRFTADEGTSALPMLFHRLTFRRRNRQNAAYPTNLFKRGCVAVGKATSGGIGIRGSSHPFARLLIGDNVTLAPKVCFVLSEDGKSNGPTVVRDKVTIGEGATIYSGVILGEGAVIAPGAEVRTDVPPGTH